MTQLTEKDLNQIATKGITKEKVKEQIGIFKEGIPFVNLVNAAVVGDGISKFTEEEQLALGKKFDKAKSGLSLLKFVPASGAASRMFKALFNFLEAYDPKKESLSAYFERTDDTALQRFSEGLKDFPFYETVQKRIKGKAANSDEELYLFVKEMMSEDALNYGFYPKGLLPFHDYGDHSATPFEKHLEEAVNYAKVGGEANLHFTISEQHIEMFTKEYERINERLSKTTDTVFNVTYSYQKGSTDTIAVDMENNPFRNSDGSLLFRPGGHGALIENLNEEEADIIFIKNIDNVVVPKVQEELTNSKKMLAGLLLEVQGKAFAYAKRIEDNNLTADMMLEIKEFLEKELNVRFVDKYPSFSLGEQINILKDKINRPIRICGMVKNEGEPGGGPFWIKNAHGHVSLQIIESAQIDMSNPKQVDILKNATHFNPVDLVCGVKNHKGEKYNLLDYVDHKQGFITEKTKEGKALKALELPGLWNGAMAYWNTIFVEVPLATFNPVKTVNDLLKPTHQVS
ncbi:DUF4301 family protein [Maribacter polysaccharolyticus]|uniref:DUF4301 family protein n=1 Tax=Maribacter polysaccharolyticus TaxID=3020831 RepID=UPI00237F0283|nr:DUF4301 family protein [Maribacter polysaccharolyticus]MDE3743027.1 DUF4301 family protein [Maribacter polysaccharolyticus]